MYDVNHLGRLAQLGAAAPTVMPAFQRFGAVALAEGGANRPSVRFITPEPDHSLCEMEEVVLLAWRNR